MKVRELIKVLEKLPQNLELFIDTNEYPRVVGAYEETQEAYGMPTYHAVLLEVEYPKEKE